MLEFKNREVTNGIKRKLQVLDIERDDTGEIKRLFVKDNILEEECIEEGTKLNAENLNKIINFLIDKEFLSAEEFTVILANILIGEIKSSYSASFVLPSVDFAICNWTLCDDYLDLIKIDKYNANINRELADAEVEIKLEVIYKGFLVSRTTSTVIKGRGLSEFDDPEEAIRELVTRVPSYLEDDYELPVANGITWELVDPNENEVRLEDNKLILLNNEGDDVAELMVTCDLGSKVGSALMRFVLGKKYKFLTENITINQVLGLPQTRYLEIYSPSNKTLFIEVTGGLENFDATVYGNNTSSTSVEITEKEGLNSLEKSGSDNFDLTLKIYSDNKKTVLYGEEKVTITYNYALFAADTTEAYWNQDIKYSNFNIRNIGGNSLYAKVTSCDPDLYVTVRNNVDSSISVIASYDYSYINGLPDVTVTYRFNVSLYSDSNYSKLLGTIGYAIHYTFSSTNPID